MKVLKRDVMPDGTNIQIEDWHESYSCFASGGTIAAYPKNRYGETFRASRDFENNAEAENAFKALTEGTKTLKEFNFMTLSNGDKVPYETKI